MQVTFALGIDPDEAAAWATLADHRSPEDEGGTLPGRLQLAAEGQAPVAISDDLEFLVPNLCLRAPAAVATEGRTVVRMASNPRQIILTREGDRVRLVDAAGTDLGAFPQDALDAALHACAVRFAEFVAALAEQFPDWIKFRDRLRSLL
jgi:hypothetical protein